MNPFIHGDGNSMGGDPFAGERREYEERQARDRREARRPGLEAIVARIREANPTWADSRVLAEAKSEWHKEAK